MIARGLHAGTVAGTNSPVGPGRAGNGTAGLRAAAAPLDSKGTRNPHLGVQLLGYSHRRTDALLDDAAAMIERLTAELVEHRWARGEVETAHARALERLAELLRRIDELEATLAGLDEAGRRSA